MSTDNPALPWGSSLSSPINSAEREAAIRDDVERHFVAHRLAVYRFLISSVGCDASEAEEIVQDTFLRLYRLLLEGRSVESVPAWVFTVARNHARSARRRRRTAERHAVEVVPRSVPSHEEAFLVEAALARGFRELTPLQAQCFTLRSQGFSLREIGAIVNVPVWGVSDAVTRAIRRLQRYV